MENEKKSSRFGVRLSAIMFVVLLVVCMAVPAFAVSYGSVGDYPESLPAIPDANYPLCLVRTANGYQLWRVNEGDRLYRNSGTKWIWQNSAGSSSPRSYYDLVDGVWVYSSGGSDVLNSGLSGVVLWSQRSYDFYNSGTYYYSFTSTIEPPPPPPDPLDSVGSGLTIVLDWVGATVSALFSGELAGLLPLVAIPVAITILIVAIVFIKRSIWGA